MAKKREVDDLFGSVDLLERKVSILESKVEESKRFAFEEIRQVLMRLNSMEDALAKLGSKLRT